MLVFSFKSAAIFNFYVSVHTSNISFQIIGSHTNDEFYTPTISER